MKVHHVGYAVSDIKDAENRFIALGYQNMTDMTEDKERKVKISFMKHADSDLVIELVEPMSDDSPAANWLKKNSNSTVPYHICYETKDIYKKTEELKNEMWLPISDCSPAPAIQNKKVIFLYHPNGGVIELVEEFSSENGE